MGCMLYIYMEMKLGLLTVVSGFVRLFKFYIKYKNY